MLIRMRWMIPILSLTLFGLGEVQLPAQSGNGMRPQPSRPAQAEQRQQTPEEFRRALWTFLADPQRGYRRWAPWPGTEQGKLSQEPHGAFMRVFGNAAVLTNPKTPPHGSVVVSENYAADRQTLATVTVMYRSQGFDPKNGDWYWIKYLPDGSVAEMDTAQGRLAMAGRVSTCIECHGGAKGNDFVFAND